MQIEVPQIDPTLWKRLCIEAKHRGTDPSTLLSQALQQFLGITHQPPVSAEDEHNHLFERLAGTWTQEEVEEFERNTEWSRRIDPELWE